MSFKYIINDNTILFAFIYYHFQFIFDYFSKIYHLKFIESFNDNIDIQYFLYFQFFSFITLILQNYEKIINKIYVEKIIYLNTFDKLYESIQNISIIYIENIPNNMIYDLFYKTSKIYYNKYFNLIELYGSIIRVLTNIYILYTIYYKFIYIIFPYLFIYYLVYHKIILYNRKIKKEDDKIVLKLNNKQSNLSNTFYNSFIGNYINKYYLTFLNNYHNINQYEIKNTKRDIIYYGTLQLFQKIIFFLLFYIYIYYKDTNKSNLYLLSIYQTTITLVYQFEYMFHNYYGFINNDSDMILYNNFINDYNLYKKDKNFLNYNLFNKIYYYISVNYQVNYNINRSILYYNISFLIEKKDRIILYGDSGVGKSTFCKIIAGHFKDYNLPISHQILYINQNNYINYKHRNLINIITQNDLNVNSINLNILNNIFDYLINIDDIKNSFSDINNFLYIDLDDKTLSGGQEKRIYLILWIYYLIININKYKVLILDEPDKGLDYKSFYNIIYNICNYDLFNNLSIIIVTHNYKIIKELSNKQIELFNNNNNITCICKKK